jgi:hypothetical protein
MRSLLVMSVLLLGTAWVAAQTDASQSTSSASQSSAAPSTSSSSSSQTNSGMSQSSSSATGQTTVEGCLSGSSGNYTLKDQNGTTYQLAGDTSQLSDHVGHEVQITGSTQSASASTPSSSTGSSAASSAQSGSSSSSQPTLNVASVKHIAATCSSSATSH